MMLDTKKSNQEGEDISLFDPVALGLPEGFILTDYTRLKGCSCKLPQSKLLVLLEELRRKQDEDVGRGDGVPHPPMGVTDCSVVPLGVKGEGGEALFLVSTTDFFFPSVEDPFLQGQIGAANVLSDLYSMGITSCDNMLMLLAASTDMDELERTVCTREILRGYAERVELAQTTVTGGQTVMNPWPLIGGVAMSVVRKSDIISSSSGRVRTGDVLVLTKPLGTQVAVNVQQWVRRPSPFYLKRIKGNITDEEIHNMYVAAGSSMRRLNLNAARAMHEYGAHAATDVTGFGILGHARNLGESSSLGNLKHGGEEVCLVLDALPILRTAVATSRLIDDHYHLLEGLAAETSGGLLVALPEECAEPFLLAVRDADGVSDGWVVGHVTRGDGQYARLSNEVRIVEV